MIHRKPQTHETTTKVTYTKGSPREMAITISQSLGSPKKKHLCQ